jgi:glycosyltransferase involved in cell wall biosynthesis
VSGADLRAAGEALGLQYGTDLRITEERISDVASMMSSATLGIVSSLGSEIICRVAEEFLLCGTPVVTSDVGSLTEVFKDESFGAPYELSQMDQAANVLRTWIDRSWNESEGDKMSRAHEAKAYFSLETMGQRLNHLLSSL